MVATWIATEDPKRTDLLWSASQAEHWSYYFLRIIFALHYTFKYVLPHVSLLAFYSILSINLTPQHNMLTVPRPTQFRDTKEGKSMIREGKDITYWWRKEGQRQEDKPLNREERSYSPTTLGDFTLSDMDRYDDEITLTPQSVTCLFYCLSFPQSVFSIHVTFFYFLSIPHRMHQWWKPQSHHDSFLLYLHVDVVSVPISIIC